MLFAIHKERHRGTTAVENALRLKHPDVWKTRGFVSSYVNGRRGTARPDPKAIKLIAEFLHVSFEWLLIGSGSMRRGGRGETPAEEAMFTARDWGIRGDACDIAWDRNKDRENGMTQEEWFEAIRMEAERLERAGVPRPEKTVAAIEAQGKVRRQKGRLDRARKRGPSVDVPESDRDLRAIGDK
jgi:transcriptional regulator with XRE-family HTH domain